MHQAELRLISLKEEELRIGHKFFEILGLLAAGCMFERMMDGNFDPKGKDMVIFLMSLAYSVQSVWCFHKRNKNIDDYLKKKKQETNEKDEHSDV